jgi:hypothetical protein
LSGRVSDDAILEAMAANPILIERPLVETEKGVVLCPAAGQGPADPLSDERVSVGCGLQPEGRRR